MTQPEYTGADRACDCDPPNICEILAELRAMKDRIENMIVSVQGLPGDHAGNVQLPFAEDIGDSTLGVSGTFAGGHAVLQVKGIADNADETARNAQDIAQIAADAANAADNKASIANSKAWEAWHKASIAGEDAGFALRAAEEAQAAVGNSVMVIGPSVAEETQVRVPYLLKDGTQGAFLVPAVDPDSAGVLTPAQFMEVTDHLDTLGRDLNNVRAEYLDKFNLTAVQLVRSKTDWEKSPTIPTLKANEYALDDGKRALNAASARADPVLMKTIGIQEVNTFITNSGFSKIKSNNLNMKDVPTGYREGLAMQLVDTNGDLFGFIGGYSSKTEGPDPLISGGLYLVSNFLRNGEGQCVLKMTKYNDNTTEVSFQRPNGTKVMIVPRG